ncbi:hypothetical protein [Haladaptatus halobius]|nr:hypothetical protein [Haladaptatus halobius]
MHPLVGPGSSELLGAETALVLVGVWLCWRAVRWASDRGGGRFGERD